MFLQSNMETLLSSYLVYRGGKENQLTLPTHQSSHYGRSDVDVVVMADMAMRPLHLKRHPKYHHLYVYIHGDGATPLETSSDIPSLVRGNLSRYIYHGGQENQLTRVLVMSMDDIKSASLPTMSRSIQSHQIQYTCYLKDTSTKPKPSYFLQPASPNLSEFSK